MIFRAPLGFRLRLKPENYATITGWDLLKYNEDVGELHRTDENGNRIKLRFATMLAQNGPEPARL